MAYAAYAARGGRGLVTAMGRGEQAAAAGAVLALGGVCVCYFWVDGG